MTVLIVDGHEFTVHARAENMVLMDLPMEFLEYGPTDPRRLYEGWSDELVPNKACMAFFASHNARVCSDIAACHLNVFTGGFFGGTIHRWIDFEDRGDLLFFKLAAQ